MRRIGSKLLIVAIAVWLKTLPVAAQVNWSEPDVTLDGKSGWVKTSFQVTEGKEITIQAKGRVRHSWMSGWHGPKGNPSPFCNSCRTSSRCNVAALIVKFGRDGKVHCVEEKISGKAPASGFVYFAVNDHPLNDNEGEFNIILHGPGVERSEDKSDSENTFDDGNTFGGQV